MKKFLALVLALSMVLALVACGGNNNAPAGNEKPSNSTQSGDTTTPSAPTNKGKPITDQVTWITAGSDMEKFIMINSESASDLDYLCNLNSALLEVNNKGQLVPAVASEWGTEDGGLTWTFKLRDDVTWVDMNGNYKADTVAQDWLTAMEWILNFHKNGSYNTSMPMQMIVGAAEYYEYTKTLSEAEGLALTTDGKFAEMVGIEAPDNYTLIYHCSKNAPYFDTLAVSAALYPMAQGMVDELGVENVLSTQNEGLWYNGPYTMTTFIHNSEKVLTKNESYWDKDCTLFDTVTIKAIDDGMVDDQLFETGEVDTATLNEATIKRVYEDASHPLHDYLVEGRPNKYSYQFHWNFAKNNEDGTEDVNHNKAFANEAFRLSLTYGLDLTKYWERNNFINPQNCENLAYTMQGLLYFSDGTDYVNKVIEGLGYATTPNADGTPRRFDMAKAQEYKAQAMEELAGEVTFPVEIDYYIKSGNQTSLDSATVVKEIFEALGTDYITLNILTYISSASQEVYTPKLQTFSINGWGADYGDPENFVGQEIMGNDNAYYANNYSNINDVDPAAAPELIATYEEFTAMAEEAAAIYDDMDARYQKYVDSEIYMLQKGLVLPCYYSIVWKWTNFNDYTKKYAMYGAQNNMYKNWESSDAGYTTAEYEQFKADFLAS